MTALALVPPDTTEGRDALAQRLATDTAPWLTLAVHMRDGQKVRETLAGLDHQELLALAVTLAACCPIDGDGTTQDLIGQLRAERKRQGLTQAEVADAAGYHSETVWAVERGRRGVRLDTVADCAQVLGLRIALVPAEATS